MQKPEFFTMAATASNDEQVLTLLASLYLADEAV